MDLSKAEPQSGSTPDPSINRQTTLPRSRTDRPAVEVNAVIRRPNMSGAEQLQKVLGLAADTAQEVFAQDQERRDNRDAASAATDFATGQKDEQRFGRSRAYHRAWSIEGAKAAATQIGSQAAQAVQGLFNDPYNPPTPEEVTGAIDGVYKAHVLDPAGKPLSFGVPEAQAYVGHALADARSQIMAQAVPKIKEATDARLLNTIAFNAFTAGLSRLEGASKVPTRDPLAPLPDPLVEAAPAATPRPTGPHWLDFEAALSAVPATVDHALAKQQLLQTVVNMAQKRMDPRVLDGLELATHKDGSPIFSPEEAQSILAARDKIADHAEKKAEKLKAQTWEDNADRFLTAFVDGNTPTLGSIRAAASRGDIDPHFAFSLVEHIQTEQREAVREARAQVRESQAEADTDIDSDVASRIAERRAGVLQEAAPQDDLELFRSGALGAGKRAASRLRELRAAAAEGSRIVLATPEVQTWGAKLKQIYGTKTSPTAQNALGFALATSNPHYDPVSYAAMQSDYIGQIQSGQNPAAAYLHAVATYGPKNDAATATARRKRIEFLEAKQRGSTR